MDGRIEKLIESFESNGWRSEGSVDTPRDWWFDDIIKLESIWSPTGKEIYFILLTDPDNIKKKIVWCVSISSDLPVEKNHSWLKQITLNDIKRTDLTEFVRQINKIVLEEK